MPSDYALTLYTSALTTVKPTAGTQYVADITGKAQYWQRSIAAQGGPWDGYFRLTGPLNELQDWFYNRLGWHVEEVAGGKTWAGMIYEMDLVYPGAVRRRSLDDVYNYVLADYTGSGVTGVVQDATSLARYGRKEQRLDLTDFPQAAAENQRDRYLRQQAYPWPRPLTASLGEGEAYLEVSLVGYWKTLTYRYSSVAAGTTVNVNTYIANILAADAADYLTLAVADTNTVQVVQSVTTPTRVWDVLQSLVDLGGASGGVAYPWRLWVDNERRVFYRQVDTTPTYAIRDDGIYTYSGGIKVAPRQVVPAVVRDMRYPMARAESGSWLADTRDTWVERVEVDVDGKLRLTTGEYDAAEILQAQLAYRYEQERKAREEAERQRQEAERQRQEAERQQREAWDRDAQKRNNWYIVNWYTAQGLPVPPEYQGVDVVPPSVLPPPGWY